MVVSQEHGVNLVKPKTHWAFDIADQIIGDKWVFDAFAIERLHLRIKSLADNVKNLTDYESIVLRGLVNFHVSLAKDCLPGCGVHGQSVTLADMPGVLLADHIDLGGKTFSVGDFVTCGEELGKVVACCVEHQDLLAIVDVYTKVAKVAEHSIRWSRIGPPRRTVWRASDMIECTAWFNHPDKSVTVIHQ